MFIILRKVGLKWMWCNNASTTVDAIYTVKKLMENGYSLNQIHVIKGTYIELKSRQDFDSDNILWI